METVKRKLGLALVPSVLMTKNSWFVVVLKWSGGVLPQWFTPKAVELALIPSWNFKWLSTQPDESVIC